MGGPGFVEKGWPLSGRQLLKILPLLVMLGLGSSVLGGAPTAQFERFFDCGRAVRCMLPLGRGRFSHSVVLYGYQGADRDAEKLALTDQLLDAALRELGVVARGQPCLVVGDFNVEPTKILAWRKGSRLGSGLTWKLLGPVLLVGCLVLPASLGCSYALSVLSVGLYGLSGCSAYVSLACLLVACA